MFWRKKKKQSSLINKFEIGQTVYGTIHYERELHEIISAEVVWIANGHIGSDITFRTADGEFLTLSEIWLSLERPIIESETIKEEVKL